MIQNYHKSGSPAQQDTDDVIYEKEQKNSDKGIIGLLKVANPFFLQRDLCLKKLNKFIEI